jgi:hypothetical protein
VVRKSWFREQQHQAVNRPTVGLRTRSLVGVVGAALSMTLATASLAQAEDHAVPPASQPAQPRRLVTGAAESCYAQLEGDTPVGISSQRFEPEYADLTTRGVDDFTLSGLCVVRSVDVAGTYFSHTGPPDSESVVVYADGGGRPGAVIARQTLVDGDVTSKGSFHLVLTRAVRLDPGTFWISVRANMWFSRGGLWGWETTSDQHGTGAMWKNPGDGFATGCTTYMDMLTCLGDVDQGPDFIFSVNKTR